MKTILASNRHMGSLLVLAVLSVPLALSQETLGTIQGTVRDSSGAVVPSAELSVVKVNTNVSLKATTNYEERGVARFE